MARERGYFRNIDIEVRGPTKLTPLGKAIQKAGGMFGNDMKWHDGGYFITLNFNFINPNRYAHSLDTQIRLAANAIESLRAKERALWDRATERVFDVGIQGGYQQRRALQLDLSLASVKRIAALNGTIRMTVYAAGRPVLTPEEEALQRRMQEDLNRRMRARARRQR